MNMHTTISFPYHNVSNELRKLWRTNYAKRNLGTSALCMTQLIYQASVATYKMHE